MCLSHKFAANRSRDDRCSIELEIAAIGVVHQDFRSGSCRIGVMASQNERCKVRPIVRTQTKAERASVLIRHTRQRVHRLNAVTSRVHSALTLAMPRSLNCCASKLVLDDREERFH